MDKHRLPPLRHQGAALVLLLILTTLLAFPLMLSQHESLMLFRETQASGQSAKLQWQAAEFHDTCERRRRRFGQEVTLAQMRALVNRPGMFDVRLMRGELWPEQAYLPALTGCIVQYTDVARDGHPDQGYRLYYITSLIRLARRYSLTETQWLLEYSGDHENEDTAQRRWYQRTGQR